MDSKNSPSTAAPNSAVNLRKRFNSLNQPRYPLKETNSNIPSPFKKQKVRLSPVGTENREPSLNSSNSKPTSVSPLSVKLDPNHLVKRRVWNQRPEQKSPLRNAIEKPELSVEIEREVEREERQRKEKEYKEKMARQKKTENENQLDNENLENQVDNVKSIQVENSIETSKIEKLDKQPIIAPLSVSQKPSLHIDTNVTETKQSLAPVEKLLPPPAPHPQQQQLHAHPLVSHLQKHREHDENHKESQTHSHLQTQTQPQIQTQIHTHSKTESHIQSQLQTQVQAQAQSNLQSQIQTQTQAKSLNRLAGDELLHWQQSWRKIMKESIVYFEGVQEYSRLQLSEYKRASKLLKLVGCEITPFYDSDVTIIVSRRSFNARKDYPSNDIFSNVSQLKIKVWDYEKVFRFLKNLGINIVTGIDESVHRMVQLSGGDVSNVSKSTKHKDNLYNLLKEEKIFGLTDRDPNAKRDDLHYFDKNYLYVYDLSQKVRPIAIREWNDSSYPVLNLTLDGKCPFISDPNDVNTERKMLRRMRKWNASQQYRDLLKKATNSMMSNIKNGIQLTTTGFSGTSTSTDKVHDEEVTIEEATSSSRKAEAEAEAAYDDKENEFDDEDTTTILSQPKRYNFKQPVMPISLSRNSSCIQVVSNSKVLDVAASGYNGASNAINMSMDSNSAVQGGNGLGPMTSQVPSRNLNNLKRRIIMKKQQRRSAEKEKEELTPGYCENCRIKYDHFREHINSTRHRNFASDDRNFKDIDNLIASLNESKSLGYVTSNGDYRYA
ncbi:hypothetical protein G9P44_004697 [Scheffersomyces stipitis]|nr:hypothetical protein G9P44_004697 [Scheffersomyces stipitis]